MENSVKNIIGYYCSILSKLVKIILLLFNLKTLFKAIIGTLGNVITICVCFTKRLRQVTTFNLIAIISLSNIVSLYQWNLDHFLEFSLKFDYLRKNLIFCKYLSYFQYCSLQYSAWLLV